MSSTLRITAIGAAALALTQFASPARAAFVVTLQEVPAGGGITNVVATGSGTIDTAGFTASVPCSSCAAVGMVGIDASIFIGPTPNITGVLEGFATGPTSFGTGGGILPNSGTGDYVGVIGSNHEILVPTSYVSGTALSDTMTFDNATFASLGVTPGTYTWHWGTGANADSFTVEIGVPEPASLTLLAVGLAGLGLVLRTRRA